MTLLISSNWRKIWQCFQEVFKNDPGVSDLSKCLCVCTRFSQYWESLRTRWRLHHWWERVINEDKCHLTLCHYWIMVVFHFQTKNDKWTTLPNFAEQKKVKLQRRIAFSKRYNLIKIKPSTTNLNRELFLTRSFNRPNALGFMQNPPGFKELKIFQNCNFFPPFFFDTRNRLPPTLSYVAAPATIYPPTNPTYFRERYAFW